MAIKKKRKASPDKVRKNPTEQELRIAKRDGFRFPLLAVPNENRLDGKKDCGYEWRADSDGKRLLFWAIKQELTVKDLQDMAA